ncbi:MAG: B12-binding domain-containing radical SAM protein [Thermoanaerobaculia bacterium]|nr:B12-binding domain-containing radical SAM protein [Thermoanaerobaculia bacterium]
MRVALLKPPIGGILGLEMLTFVEPLGLIAVAACLEADGHDCRVIDLRIDGLEAGLADLVRFSPDLVGIQCNFTTERNRSVRLAEAVRRELPTAFVVVGGHDASRDPGWFLHPAIDAVAIGDGEAVLPALVETLARGRDPATAPGLALARDGRQLTTGPPPWRADLDSLPLPARHLIARYAPSYYINFRKPLALLETARGCPFKCNFCSVWKFHESTFRQKSPARVVAELAAIEAPNVFVTDDIFWMDVRRGEEMARQIRAAGIRKYFTVQTRTDIVCKFPHLIEAWKGCGELAIFLGVEAVTDEGLEGGQQGEHRRHESPGDRPAQGDGGRLHAELHRRPGLGPRGFRAPPELDRGDRGVQQRLLGAHPAARNRPLGERAGEADDRRLGALRHRARGAPDPAAARGVLRRVRAALAARAGGSLPGAGQGADLLPAGSRARHRAGGLGAVRKGMNIASVFSRPETFLAAHAAD